MHPNRCTIASNIKVPFSSVFDTKKVEIYNTGVSNNSDYTTNDDENPTSPDDIRVPDVQKLWEYVLFSMLH